MPTHELTDIDWGAIAAAIPLRSDESAWSAEDLREIYSTLLEQADRLRSDLAADAEALSNLMSDRSQAGEDQADTGSANVEREQELALNQNLRDMLRQCDEALFRIEGGSYGRCDSCGGAIGRARLQAYPRAVKCVACKQREERRG